MELKGKTVTVVGLGNSGVNAALLARDVSARVRATDFRETPSVLEAAALLRSKGVEVETGGHTEPFVKSSDLVVVSPGVENTSPAIRWADKHRVPIIGEMEFAFRFCQGSIIGITGTNGKSTVTALIGKILKDAGIDSVVCGNIGNSLCGEMKRIKKNTWVVLEVSSFQLERIELFRPRIAVILNITDDHMDRYDKFSEYFNEKLKIFRNQVRGDALVLNYDDTALRPLKDKAGSRALFYSRINDRHDAFVRNGWVYCVTSGKPERVISVRDIALKGLHNVENVLASSLVASLVGVRPESMAKTIRSFKGLSHRFETVAVIDGVEYIDDSKGTTVDSTRRALESCDRPVVLIAGGKDKKSDYSAARDIIRKKAKYVVLIGEAKGRIKKALGGVIETREEKDMAGAVELARQLAPRDSIVLLSPMCSSFDMFRDYKERGEAFRNAVLKMVIAAKV